MRGRAMEDPLAAGVRRLLGRPMRLAREMIPFLVDPAMCRAIWLAGMSCSHSSVSSLSSSGCRSHSIIWVCPYLYQDAGATLPLVTRVIFFIISVLGIRSPCRHFRTADTEAPMFLANSGEVMLCLIRYSLNVIMFWGISLFVPFCQWGLDYPV